MELPYLAYFNLTEEPFSTVPSPRYFFLTSTHATALEKTAYVVGAKKGLAVVFGATGTGKSKVNATSDLHPKEPDSTPPRLRRGPVEAAATSGGSPRSILRCRRM